MEQSTTPAAAADAQQTAPLPDDAPVPQHTAPASGARRPVLLIVLTIAAWLAVLVVVVVSYFLTRQPPLEPITVGG